MKGLFDDGVRRLVDELRRRHMHRCRLVRVDDLIAKIDEPAAAADRDVGDPHAVLLLQPRRRDHRRRVPDPAAVPPGPTIVDEQVATERRNDEPGAGEGAEQSHSLLRSPPEGRSPHETPLLSAADVPLGRSRRDERQHAARRRGLRRAVGEVQLAGCRAGTRWSVPAAAGTVAIASSVAPAGIVSASASNALGSRWASLASTRWCMPSSVIVVLSKPAFR